MGRQLFEVELYDHYGSFIFNAELWKSPGSWSHDDNKKWPWQGNGWQLYVDVSDVVKDTLFGKTIHEKKTVERLQFQLELPEGTYPAEYTVTQERWYRPRSPMPKHWLYCDAIEIPKGVPVPGKGTMAHNCGDDATFGITFAASSDSMGRNWAAHKAMEDVMHTRAKYGSGMRWVPSDGWPAHCKRRNGHVQPQGV